MMTAAAYHKATVYLRQAMPGHRLDWSAQPATAKRYPGAASVDRGRPVGLEETTVVDLVQGGDPAPRNVFDKDTLLTVLQRAYGITAERNTPGGVFRYRSAPSAGALYPVELYCIVHAGIGGLPSGVYYFDPEGGSLACIQPWKGTLPRMLPEEPSGCTLVFSGVFYKSAWKYNLRAYRYLLLDAGHLLENLHLAARAAGLGHRVHYDFDDDRTGRFLGLDDQLEVPLAMVTFPGNPQRTEPDGETDLSGGMERAVALPFSAQERGNRQLATIHRAGARSTGKCAAASPPAVVREPVWWRENGAPIAPANELDFEKAVSRRRSRRNYIDEKIASDAFWRLIGVVAAGLSRRNPAAYPYAETTTCGFITGRHAPLSSGFYLLSHNGRRHGLCVDGILGAAMASACLEQRWLAAAGLDFLFFTDPAWCDRAYGPRGYRYAMLNAGRLGHLVYLEATALGLGACGIGAFFDEEIRILLDLPQAGMPLYLVAAGATRRPKGKQV